ncbi:MAG: glycosyl hydrolase 53 family protein [Candidatus Sumerlaeia bacterium]|nr:glycosyl hydrolase 53 family protein [Candidatus Sumerlaeia bacterium]
MSAQRRLILAAIAVAAAIPSARSVPADFAIGADVSFLKQAEERGVVFKDGGVSKPGLQILKDHGYNWIRLRLFHTPPRLPNNLDYTLALAADARKLGFKFLLNYHYSDTWADPGKQFIPKAWEGKSHAELVQAVFEYTRDTIAAFRNAGVMPDMVQIGNEISNGMLWPDGKLPAQWDNFADLLKAGIRGVEAGRGHAPRPRIMIHIDKGGNQKATKAFFDKLNAYAIPYDVIGQSYYPWWHGTLDALRENLAFMASEYQKDIVLVEVAYCWRPTEYRTQSGPFPESPEGQRAFLDTVHRAVRATPNGRGAGIFWWEPAVEGRLRNRGFFDDDGNALPVIHVFDSTRPLVYLFTSFRGNGEDGLHLAWSNDGYKWTDLGTVFLAPKVGVSKLMRDPCLIQAPNGTFHMVWTTGWSEKGIGYARSKDLIHWSDQKYLEVMAHEPTTLNAWAPEIFYDAPNQQFIIYWSSTIPGRFPGDDEHDQKRNHRMYYVTTKDFESFSPTRLFFDPGYSVIDSIIVPRRNDYVLVLKDERRDMRRLRVAFGDSPFGPFRNISEPFTPPFTEGPSALQIGNEWIIYFDMYRDRKYGAVKTKDFRTFTDITGQISFPPGHKHGTVLRISKDVLDRLIQSQ